MPDIFGAPTGIVTAEKEMQDNALFGLTYQQEAQKVQTGAIQLAQQERMLQMLNQRALAKQQAGPQAQLNSTDSAISDMYDMANIYEATGQLDKAGRLFSQASTMARNQQEIESRQLTSALKKFSTMSSLMDGVVDEASWRRANATYTMITGEPSPYAQLPYSPQVVQKVQAGIASQKDRALTRAAAARELDSRAAAKEHEARIPLIKKQAELAQVRIDAAIKAGGKNLLPNVQDMKAVAEVIASDFPNVDETDPQFRRIVREVAERKKELQIRENLSPSEAAKRAVREAQNGGELNTLNTPLGRTFNRPLPLPTDRAKWQVNKWYATPKGVGMYSGPDAQGRPTFLRPSEVPGAMEAGRPYEPEGDEDEDDDDNDDDTGAR